MPDGFDFQTWGLLLLVLTSQGAMFRWLIGKMREDRDASQMRDAEIHTRINDVKDNYLRRDDLEAHISPLKEGQTAMTNSIDRLHSRFDDFLTAQTTGRD